MNRRSSIPPLATDQSPVELLREAQKAFGRARAEMAQTPRELDESQTLSLGLQRWVRDMEALWDKYNTKLTAMADRKKHK